MFFGVAAVSVVSELNGLILEHQAFEAFCDTLPIEKAEELRKERNERLEKQSQHNRNLEVAREGRSKNFWGDR